MLRAAMAMINRTGLTVSLDHIRFEDVIRDADVARSTAYRHWPYRDLFFSDLVTELAKSAGPAIIADEISLIKKILGEHPDWLETPQRRHNLILELIRQLALLDFRSILASAEWRTYLALHATFSGLSLRPGNKLPACSATGCGPNSLRVSRPSRRCSVPP